jgi:sporulation-control protein
MRKVLASVGIGNATVDTVLPSTTVTPGESVEAEVRIEGGEAEQEVDRIELELETRFRTADGYAEGTVDRLVLSEGLTVEPDTSESLDATVEIPWHTPVTLGNARVWVETELEIPLAVDPEDRDYLDVQPTERMRALFDAAESLGLSFRTADCEADPYGRYGTGRFVQEFEFRPSGGPFAGALDEVEFVTDPGPDALEVYVEVDRRGGLLSEIAETDESRTSLSVASTDVDEVARALRAEIERYA